MKARKDQEDELEMMREHDNQLMSQKLKEAKDQMAEMQKLLAEHGIALKK